jgi:uncharacterized membrane protein
VKVSWKVTNLKIFFDETQKERGKINTNYSILRDSLKNKGFQVEAYNDFPINEKSLKCDIFVFACPDGSKLTPAEIEAIIHFVEKGGGLLVISNAGGDRGLRTNMNEVLNKMGIEVLSDQIKDEANNEFNMPTHPVIKDMKNHPITKGVAEIVIVAGSSVRGSSNMSGIALTSPVAEPPNAPAIVGGEYKKGRVVAIGSYRLFSNYGAGLTLRNNRTLALNIFSWLARQETGTSVSPSTTETKPKTTSVTSSQTVTPPTRSTTITPPVREKATSTPPTAPSKPTLSTTSTTPSVSNQRVTSSNATDASVSREIERLRADMAEMREIIARLYSDSLGYLQEMKEEVRMMT